MTNLFARAIVALSILLLIGGCGTEAPGASTATAPPSPTATSTTEPTATVAAQQFAVYDSPVLGASIEHPEDWQIVEKADASAVLFLVPQQPDPGAFRENVSLTTTDLPSGTLTLDAFTSLALEQVGEYVVDYALAESVPATLSGLPAQRVVYSGKQGIRDLRWLQMWTLVNDQVYIVTYTATENTYPTYLEAAERMIGSLNIE